LVIFFNIFQMQFRGLVITATLCYRKFKSF